MGKIILGYLKEIYDGFKVALFEKHKSPIQCIVVHFTTQMGTNEWLTGTAASINPGVLMTYGQRHCPEGEMGDTVKCINVHHWVWEYSHSDLYCNHIKWLIGPAQTFNKNQSPRGYHYTCWGHGDCYLTQIQQSQRAIALLTVIFCIYARCLHTVVTLHI